jgi:hypothetical protein
MLRWAARARANPHFDDGDRDFRLAIARSGQEILDAVRRGEPVADGLDSLHRFMAHRRTPRVILARLMVKLPDWANEDEARLALALRPFTEPDVPPVERVRRFTELLQARADEDETLAGLTLGSFLNFASAPERFPIVRVQAFEWLERFLGESPVSGSVSEQYAHHLRFAERVHETLVGAGVPTRDMADTEALMLICWEDREFWVDDDDGRLPRHRPPRHYLTACAIYRNEAPYLAEWLEFHLLVGFERFYLYDNFSDDEHLEVLRPYIDEGIVLYHEWPHPYVPGQAEAYKHCLDTYREEARWIGFFDIDEFLFSPTYRPVSEVLTEYEQWNGVVVNAPRFGPSGHRTTPDGLVIENFLVHVSRDSDRTVKSIVDPAAAEACWGAHVFRYRKGVGVDEKGYPVHVNATKAPSLERLRINHYYWKSDEELRDKQARPVEETGGWKRQPQPSVEELDRIEAEHGVRDETILPYVERVREALARRARALS